MFEGRKIKNEPNIKDKQINQEIMKCKFYFI